MVRVPPSSSSHFGDVDKVWVLGCDCVLEGASGLRRRRRMQWGDCESLSAVARHSCGVLDGYCHWGHFVSP